MNSSELITEPPRRKLYLFCLPGLLMLCLFYSLAIHMRLRLGTWPSGIGEAGFGPALTMHANVAATLWEVIAFASLVILSGVLILALCSVKLRSCRRYLAAYAFALLLCWTLMQLAPAPFLSWWRD